MTREEALDLIEGIRHGSVDALGVVLNILEQEPCDDAISREAALIIAGTHTLTVDETIKAIEKLPSVMQKSGKWKREEFPNFTVAWFCNKCGIGSYRKFNYCPNCGACMKEGRTLDEFIEDSKESEDKE